MKSFTRSPLFAVLALLMLGVVLAHAGVIDAHSLLAAPLLFPIGNISTDVPAAKLLRAAMGKREESVKAMAAIMAAVPDGGALTEEQQKSFDAHKATLTGLDSDISRFQTMIEAQRNTPDIGKIIGTKDNREDDPKRGFKSLGEFAASVYRANPRLGGDVDERLRIAAGATTFGNEGTGQDGGFLVPTEFSTQIATLSLDTDNFLSKCDGVPISGNSMAFPSDETTPWGTNGIRAYWAAEASQATQTKPLLKPNILRLNKLFALVPVTDELLADAPAISSYLTAEIAESIKWKSNDAVINGTGAGQPLGILNGGGLVVIAKEAAQAASTVLPANIAKILAAMPASYQQGAEWVIAPDAFPAIITLTLGNYPLYMPPVNGIQGAPGGYLLGKPINLSQSAAAFSSQGDISLVNFKAYRTISKDGVQLAQSMHLYFDYDETAFRATFRVDGQPKFKSAIVQARGAQNLSPYVTLAAR